MKSPSRTKPAPPSTISWAASSALLFFGAVALAGCEDCAPKTGVQQLQQELATTCSFQDSAGVQRLTKNPAASTQPAIAAHGDGHVVAWIDDREMPAGLYVQRLDPLGATTGQPRRLKTSASVRRPRVASTGKLVVITFAEDIGDHQKISLQVLNSRLEPQLGHPQKLTTTDEHHGPGIAVRDGRFVVALAAEEVLQVFDIQLRPASGASDADGGDANTDGGAPADADVTGHDGDRVLVDASRRTLTISDETPELGNIDLAFHGERLFLAADHPDGWSVVIGELGQEQVRRVVQVIDDRRHPMARWAYPSIDRASDEHLAIIWQGPGMGMAALYLMEFDLDGNPIGQERTLEAVVRDDDERPVGRAPAFHPALAATSQGLIAAFADNRYANSEILLAPFTCGGER